MNNTFDLPQDDLSSKNLTNEENSRETLLAPHSAPSLRRRRKNHPNNPNRQSPSSLATAPVGDKDPLLEALALPGNDESDEGLDLISSLNLMASNASGKSTSRNSRSFSEERPFSQRRPSAPTETTIPVGDPVSLNELKSKNSLNICTYAETLGIENAAFLSKNTLMQTLLKRLAEKRCPIHVTGVLDIPQEGGFGFLRLAEMNYASFPDDVQVATHQIKTMGLRKGDTLTGELREPKNTERYFSVGKITSINGQKPESLRHRVHFDTLVPLYPSRRIQLSLATPETKDMTLRVIDVVSPLGFGQRALIVAPPRSGKTTIMQSIASALSRNHPEAYLMVLLIDERPEEVTDMVRSVRGEVISSTFDEPATRHVQVAEIAVEKAKRLVESGMDVVILLDNLTRLARAYNTVMPSSGKILTGGVDANALQRPKRFFGAARNLENGGSLTVIATALVETGSRMDEVIFEEFKGRGNCEIILDRKLADRRTFPAIDIIRSGTRKEEMLVERSILSKMWILRRILSSMMGQGEAIDFLLEKLRETKSNEEFFNNMNNGAPVHSQG